MGSTFTIEPPDTQSSSGFTVEPPAQEQSTWDKVKSLGQDFWNSIPVVGPAHELAGAVQDWANKKMSPDNPHMLSPAATFGTGVARDVAGAVKGATSPAGVATAAGLAAAPEVVGPALAVHGAYSAVKDAGDPRNPDVLQRELNDAAEVAGGAGATGAAVRAGGGPVTQAVKDAIPNAGRAGASLQDVRNTVGDVPIDTGKVGDAALDLYEQSQRGAVLPKAVRQLVTRMTDPSGDPLTYAEAKDFQSNISRLSANEKMNLNANTARLVGQLNANLKDALTDAADTQGKGAQFTQAMKEYHNAMTLKGWSETAKETAIKAALTATGLVGLKKFLGLGQ